MRLRGERREVMRAEGSERNETETRRRASLLTLIQTRRPQ